MGRTDLPEKDVRQATFNFLSKRQDGSVEPELVG
jgi:hypothetical protein